MFQAFNSQTYGQLSFEQTVEKLLAFIHLDPSLTYEFIIGTDSLLYAGNKAEFVSAIIIHKGKNGGIYFWSKHSESHMHSLRQRIFQEALLSLQLPRC